MPTLDASALAVLQVHYFSVGATTSESASTIRQSPLVPRDPPLHNVFETGRGIVSERFFFIFSLHLRYASSIAVSTPGDPFLYATSL